MTIAEAIDAEMIAAIIDACGISEDHAKLELAIAKKIAKQMGLPLADTLAHMGVVK